MSYLFFKNLIVSGIILSAPLIFVIYPFNRFRRCGKHHLVIISIKWIDKAKPWAS